MKIHKQFFIQCRQVKVLTNGGPIVERPHIGNASSLKSAKSMITNYRRNNQEYEPADFEVFDCWADTDEKTGFAPCVYSEK